MANQRSGGIYFGHSLQSRRLGSTKLVEQYAVAARVESLSVAPEISGVAYNSSRYNLAQKHCDSAPAQDITHTSQNISLLCNKNQAKTQPMKEIAGIATNTIPMGLLVY